MRSTKSDSLRAAGLALLLSAGMLAAAPASAFLVTVDAFTVERNGSSLFFDTFGNAGSVRPAPNFADGTPADYSVSQSSSGMVPELSGRAVLDPTTNGRAARTTFGATVQTVRLQLQTNDDSSNTLDGLKPNMTFATGALFDIPSSFESGISSNFFLSLRERSGIAGDPISNLRDLHLQVHSTGFGTPVIQYRVLDWTSSTSSSFTVASAPFIVPIGADQIELRLEKNDANTNGVSANFQFWANGSELGTSSTPLGLTDVFLRSNAVQASFGATVGVVPLPPSALLMLAGLGALVAGARRRPRRG